MDLMNLVAKLILDTSDYDKGIKSAKDALPSMSAGAIAAGNLISAGFQQVGSVIGNFASGIMNTGKEFEASLSQVVATTGLTGAEAEKAYAVMKAAAEQAGATTAFTAKQSADALNYLALAGYDAEKAAGVLPSVLSLAAAGGMDLAYASDLATDAMAALGIEANKANLDAFGDKLARTASRSNTSVAQLGEAILTVGGTANQLSGETVELNTALGVLANRGIKGSEGGTALRNVILTLTAGTKKSKEALNALGISIKDAHGNMRPLDNIMGQFNKKLSGMSEVEKMDYLNKIFNKVDLAAVQGLMAGVGEEWDNLEKEIKDASGAMAEMEKTQLDNLQGDITIMESAIDGLRIAIFNGLNGTAREAVQGFTNAIGVMTEKVSAWISSDAVQQKLSKITASVSKFLGLMSNNLGPILDGVLNLFGLLADGLVFVADNFEQIISVVGTAITVFGTMKAATAALNFAKLALSAGPLVLAFMALADIVKASGITMDDVKVIFTKSVEKIKNVLNKLSPPIQKVFGMLKGILGPLKFELHQFFEAMHQGGEVTLEIFGMAMKAAFERIWVNLQNTFSVVGQMITKWFTSIEWQPIIDKVSGWAVGAWEAIKGVFALAGAKIFEWFTAVDWEAVKATVGGWAQGALDKIGEVLSLAGQAIYNWFTSVDWEGIKNKVGGWAQGAFDKIKTFLSGVGAKLVEWFTSVDWDNVIQTVGGWASNAFDKIKEFLSGVGAKLKEWFTSVDWESVKATVGGWGEEAYQKIHTALGNVGKKLKTWFTNTDWNKVKSKVSSWTTGALTKIQEVLGNLAETIAGWFKGKDTDWEGVKDKVSGWASAAWTIIKAVFEGAAEGIANWFKGNEETWELVKTTVSGWAQSAWDAIKAIFENFGTNFVTWITSFDVNEILEAFKKLGGQIWNSIKSGLGNIPKNIVNAITGGTSEAGEQAGENTSGGFVKGITSAVNKVTEGAKNLASSAVSGIKNFLKIKSPSKVTDELGQYFGEGYVHGIIKKIRDVMDASEAMARASINPLENLTAPTMALRSNLNTSAEAVTGGAQAFALTDDNITKLADAIVAGIQRSGMDKGTISIDGREFGRYLRNGMEVGFV